VVIGFEGVGIVVGVGESTTEFETGDRLAHGIPPLESWSVHVLCPRWTETKAPILT
jgi:NADPH:quinone reductase-like Zn-dependent oxidoreductase